MAKSISGFSKLSKWGKLQWIAENFFDDSAKVIEEFSKFWHEDERQQKILEGFSENTLTNFPLPFGVAPNFLINDQWYAVPMVIEESSVVAAASSAAKYWSTKGGFKAEVLGTNKIGQVHFKYKGSIEVLKSVFDELKGAMLSNVEGFTCNMRERGGGVLDVELLALNELGDEYYQLRVDFETCESMGANFVNTVVEDFAETLKEFVAQHPAFEHTERTIDIVMAILSNYTPECLVRASVECPIDQLNCISKEMDNQTFAQKFYDAIKIAQTDPYRATTHNKGIFNGIDAVVIATGNDFRAIEACGHAYAARNKGYRSLSDCSIQDGVFRFWLEVPLSVGTVGGLTKLHPIAKRSLELLGNPTAKELMMVIASTGLAQNFAAVRSLTTTGIQKGHMKMHLMNILNHLEATDQEKMLTFQHFKDKVVSFSAVRDFLENQKVKVKAIRNGKP